MISNITLYTLYTKADNFTWVLRKNSVTHNMHPTAPTSVVGFLHRINVVTGETPRDCDGLNKYSRKIQNCCYYLM